ncbi:MAG: hypothetical protein L0Y71_25795 [Gemmataceae bacterium]|nr:hypothetical protein [Gemmataceae bacterium]
MTKRMSIRGVVTLCLATLGLLLVLAEAGAGGRPAVKVTVQDEKPVVTEVALPVDPTPRIRYNVAGMTPQIRTEQNQQLHLSHFPMFNIDGRIMQAGQAGGRFEKNNAPLPRTPGGKLRQGYMSVFVIDDLRITMMAELVPTKSTDNKKREMGTVLVRYTVENTGKQARKFGLKTYFDMYVVTNDGAMFAAPNMPGKILDGIELKEKTLPDFVQCLERPNLKNPGYVAHLTVNLGSSIEKASRVVLTRHGAGGFNGWDMPAIASMGDSAMGVFFDPKEIRPGGRREFGYAYGKGVAIAPESEGNVEVRLTGSFEPGKLFTVTALINDPVLGQALTLDLPKGMALVEGREIQPVPQPTTDPPQSFVVWRCRVLELGQHPLRLRSSTGVTQTKLITISRAD